MEPHRHRIHPLIWDALAQDTGGSKGKSDGVARRELAAFLGGREAILARRPVYSQIGEVPPWEAAARGEKPRTEMQSSDDGRE
jgi:hypothetical protein